MTLLAPPDDVAMGERLLERGAELRALEAAVGEAATGRGGVVLVSGEAGIGKTSLVRAFLKAVPHSARLLVGACDDLVTPRTFGPLRDAVALSDGPLADELTGEPDGESVYGALLEELSYPAHTTVLVVEATDARRSGRRGLTGDWTGAAALWGRIGDPYERALELAASGEVAPTLEALETLDRLGAAPAARLVRRRLRDLGVLHLPRGPRRTTRAKPSGLTDRQLDVLALLADELTNAEIAERLILSVRTVDHHVSAILTKLGVTSRRQAARIAAQPAAARDPE
jgi:DNA-binding CsgD family transcriptional regulator